MAGNGGKVRGLHQSSVTLVRATRLPVAPIASTAVSRPTSEPEDFLRPKTLAAKTVAPLGAQTLLCQARRQRRAIAACWDV
jgi:hypothetical protein